MTPQRSLFARRELQTRSGFVRIERGCVITSTGIRIGSAYMGIPPQSSADAETIQRALLARRRRAPTWLSRLLGSLRGSA